jgi:hypothetical protein
MLVVVPQNAPESASSYQLARADFAYERQLESGRLDAVGSEGC